MKMTTLAFVRSLVSWQHAMMASCAGPTPTALFALVNLELAAVARGAALEWVEFLERVAAAHEGIVEERLARGVREDAVANTRSLAQFVREAEVSAREHLASFDEAGLRSTHSPRRQAWPQPRRER